MLGGLPRRASFIRSLALKAALVKVENGDLTKAAGRQEELKAETLIEMLNDLEYDAINLGEKGPTSNGDAFAGSATCRNCHQEAYRIWQGSGHAKAMQTLMNEKHDKDPECATCHVVGLEKESGFIGREQTPDLLDVGCESCHGTAARHTRDPQTPMPAAGSDS